jgi:hypothetical protein
MLKRLSPQVTDAAAAAALRKVKGGRKGAMSARLVTPEIAGPVPRARQQSVPRTRAIQ